MSLLFQSLKKSAHHEYNGKNASFMKTKSDNLKTMNEIGKRGSPKNPKLSPKFGENRENAIVESQSQSENIQQTRTSPGSPNKKLLTPKLVSQQNTPVKNLQTPPSGLKKSGSNRMSQKRRRRLQNRLLSVTGGETSPDKDVHSPQKKMQTSTNQQSNSGIETEVETNIEKSINAELDSDTGIPDSDENEGRSYEISMDVKESHNGEYVGIENDIKGKGNVDGEKEEEEFSSNEDSGEEEGSSENESMDDEESLNDRYIGITNNKEEKGKDGSFHVKEEEEVASDGISGDSEEEEEERNSENESVDDGEGSKEEEGCDDEEKEVLDEQMSYIKCEDEKKVMNQSNKTKVIKNQVTRPEEELGGNVEFRNMSDEGEITSDHEEEMLLSAEMKNGGTTSVLRNKKNPVAQTEKCSKDGLDIGTPEKSKRNTFQEKKSKSNGKNHKKYPEITKFTVFITNLPNTTTEEDLKMHFKDVPNIQKINLMQDTKTGKFLRRATMEMNDFVSYAKALTMHKSELDDNTLNVVPDRSMRHGMSKGLVHLSTKSNEPTRHRLCVSELPASLKWKQIKKHFSASASVKRFVIPSNDGKVQNTQRTMILEFDDQESYENILAMNGSLFEESTITVEPLLKAASGQETKKRKVDEISNEAPQSKKQKVESPEESEQTSVEQKFNVFVGSIPLTVTDKMLKQHFKNAGEVVECVIYKPSKDSKRSTQTGQVVMADEKGYQNALALNGSLLADQKIVAEKYMKRVAKKKKRYVAFVGNIPFTTKDADMRKHFKDVGNILDVRFPLNKENKPLGYAYVELPDQASFERCLSLHHSFMNGRRINVVYSTSRKTSGDKKPNSSVTKHKLFKLQTLSQTQQFQKPTAVKRKRSKPDKKKRAFNRSQRNEIT